MIFLVSARHNLATVNIFGRVEAGEMALAIAYCTVLILIMLAVVFAMENAWDVRKSHTAPWREPAPAGAAVFAQGMICGAGLRG